MTQDRRDSIRIGFDGRALDSPAAGVRRYTRELFGALAALEKFEVVAIGPRADTAIPAGVTCAPAEATLPTNIGWMLMGLPRAARAARVDLFHAPAYTVPWRGVRPVVVTIHDVSYERHPEWYPYRRDPIRRQFYRFCARAADHVITDSQFSKSEIVAAYELPADRISVVPLAASLVFASAEVQPLPGSIPRWFILHVGDLHERRNLGVALRAVLAIRRRRRELQDLALVVAGVDRSHGELEQLAASATGAVFQAGTVTDESLSSLYRAALALVYPSRYEGFGLPLLEAMASGCPVIASNCASIPEVVGDAGVLLDPDDQESWEAAIEHLVDHPADADRLRTRGVSRALEFSWRRTAEGTARVYMQCLERAR